MSQNISSPFKPFAIKIGPIIVLIELNFKGMGSITGGGVIEKSRMTAVLES